MQLTPLRFILAVALGLVAALPALAQDTAGATARQLSRAVIAGVGIGADRAEARGELDPGVVACVRTIDPLSMEPTYRRLLASRFTDAEIALLDAHYASPLGELEWRSSLNALREQHGVPAKEPVTVTPAQQAAMDAFNSTDVGKRLGHMTSEQDAESTRILQEDIAKVIETCR